MDTLRTTRPVIPDDARPDPPHTIIAAVDGRREIPILARYHDLVVHRAEDEDQRAKGGLTVTHEGTGLALAHFTPSRPRRSLDPAALLEALAFAWDVDHDAEPRAALDAVARILPRRLRQKALDAALRAHMDLYMAWVRARDQRRHDRVERYQQRPVPPSTPAFTAPRTVLLPARRGTPRALSPSARALLASVEQQAIAKVRGAWETPFPLALDTIIERAGLDHAAAIEALKELLARDLVRPTEQPAPPIRARARRPRQSPFARIAALFAAAAAPSTAARDAPAPLPDTTPPLPTIGRRMSPKQMAAAGWTRVDPRPWSKLHARWLHAAGWRLEHCGHPTAIRPWALYSPAGDQILTGALHATPPNPRLGAAWVTLAEAMTFVGKVIDGTLIVPGLSPAPRAPTRRPRSPFARIAAAFEALR